MKNFLILFSILFIPTAQLSAISFKSTGGKVIAYYNSDSILKVMPEYKKAMDSIAFVAKLLNDQDSIMNITYFNKIIDFQNNCLRWTPLIKSIHQKEISDLYKNILAYRVEVNLDLEEMRTKLITPLVERINSTAKDIATKNEYLVLFDAVAAKTVSPKAKVMDISSEICAQLGIPEVKK